MSDLGPVIAFAIFVAIAVLAPLFGVDTRPSAQDRPEPWFGAARR